MIRKLDFYCPYPQPDLNQSQSIKFIPTLMNRLSEILEKRDFNSLTRAGSSIHRSHHQDWIKFLKGYDIYQLIFTANDMHSISMTCRENYQLIANNTFLHVQLIQSQIVKKMNNLFSTIEDDVEKVIFLTSLAQKKIKMGSTGYIHDLDVAVSILQNLEGTCNLEIGAVKPLGMVLGSLDVEKSIWVLNLCALECEPMRSFQSLSQLSKKDRDASKIFLGASLKCIDVCLEHCFFNMEYDDIPYDTMSCYIDNAKLMMDLSPEEGMKAFDEILKFIELKCHEEWQWEIEKVSCLCAIGEQQALYYSMNEASETIEKALTIASKLKQAHPDMDEEILGKVAGSLVPVDLKRALDLVYSIKEGENRKQALIWVIEASAKLFADQVKNNFDCAPKTFSKIVELFNLTDEETYSEVEWKIRVIAASYATGALFSIKMLLKNLPELQWPEIKDCYLNRIIEDLDQIKDPRIQTCLYLEISKAIDSSKEFFPSWWTFKKKLLSLAAQKVSNVVCSFHQCTMYIELAEQFYFDKSLANDTVSHAINIVENYEFSNHYLDKSSLWYLISKAQFDCKLDGLGESKIKYLQVIEKTEDLEDRINAMLKYASLMKEQEIFNLAIETALKLNNEFKISDYLAKIASLDLKQTPLILDKIQASQHESAQVIEIEFLKAIEF